MLWEIFVDLLMHCLSPSRGVFNVLELLDGMLPFAIYVPRAHRYSALSLGAIW